MESRLEYLELKKQEERRERIRKKREKRRLREQYKFIRRLAYLFGFILILCIGWGVFIQ